MFDLLASLVDKSLVLAEPDGQSLRYRLLESTRAYALEKLSDALERDPLAGRHLRYLRDRFAELRERMERTARESELTVALGTELDDVRAALDAAPARGDVLGAAALLAELDRTWDRLGLDDEGVTRIETFLAALPEGEPLLRARLSTVLYRLLGTMQKKARAMEAATQAVAHARTSGNAATLAWALSQYALASANLNRLDDAQAALAEAEVIPGTSANLRVTLLQARSFLAGSSGDLETGVRIDEQLRKEHHSLGNTRTEHVAVLNLAEHEHARSQTQRAIALIREILPERLLSPDKTLLSNLLGNLAGYLVATDEVPAGIEAAHDAIRGLAAREPDHVHVAIAIEHLALAYALQNAPARAASLEGYVQTAFQRHGFVREYTETTTYKRLTALLSEGLAPDELARLTAEGAALTPEDAIALALEKP